MPQPGRIQTKAPFDVGKKDKPLLTDFLKGACPYGTNPDGSCKPAPQIGRPAQSFGFGRDDTGNPFRSEDEARRYVDYLKRLGYPGGHDPIHGIGDPSDAGSWAGLPYEPNNPDDPRNKPAYTPAQQAYPQWFAERDEALRRQLERELFSQQLRESDIYNQLSAPPPAAPSKKRGTTFEQMMLQNAPVYRKHGTAEETQRMKESSMRGLQRQFPDEEAKKRYEEALRRGVQSFTTGVK